MVMDVVLIDKLAFMEQVDPLEGTA